MTSLPLARYTSLMLNNTKSTLPRFTIYHLMSAFARDAYFRAFPSKCYTLVATVACHELDETFEVCNNGVPGRDVACWQDNPEQRSGIVEHRLCGLVCAHQRYRAHRFANGLLLGIQWTLQGTSRPQSDSLRARDDY